jgi:hypothetical protein
MLFIRVRGVESISAAGKSIFYRTSMGQLIGTLYMIDTFPKDKEFLGIKYLPNPIPFMSRNINDTASVMMMDKYNPGARQHRGGGSVVTYFFGEAHATFGLSFAFFSMFLVGMYLQIWHVICIKYLPKTPLWIAFYIYLIIDLTRRFGLNFWGGIVPNRILYMFIAISTIILAGRLIRTLFAHSSKAKIRYANLGQHQ